LTRLNSRSRRRLSRQVSFCSVQDCLVSLCGDSVSG